MESSAYVPNLTFRINGKDLTQGPQGARFSIISVQPSFPGAWKNDRLPKNRAARVMSCQERKVLFFGEKNSMSRMEAENRIEENLVLGVC